MNRRHRVLAVGMVGLGILAGCNLVLGIEEQPTRPVPEDAAVDAVEEPATDAYVRPPFEACARDADCLAPNGCLTPHCDTVLGACTYALCEPKDRTCAMGVCDTSTFTCSEPQPYAFRSTSYDLPGVTSGCGTNPDACVAASFPFVFLGTRDGVIALRGDDLAGRAPVKVPIADLATKPQQIIASGRRIWVLGSVQGQAPAYQLPIAFIDVPSDPTVATLRARTALVSYPFSSAVGFPAPNGGLFVANPDAAQGFPTALVQAPLAEGTSIGLATANAADAGAFDASAPPSKGTITMYRVGGVPPGAALVASSGARLVLHRLPSTFNLVAEAGTPAAATLGDLALAPPLIPIGPQTFAQGADGTVTMTAAVAADPLTSCDCTTQARLQWLFHDPISTTTDVSQSLDLEGYVNMQVLGGACRQCTGEYFRPRLLGTWLGRRTVLTAAPYAGGPAARMLTDVRVLGRDPLEGYPKRRAQTKAMDTPKGDFAIDRIALTSANGIGYLVLADAQGNDISFSIFDPRCDGK